MARQKPFRPQSGGPRRPAGSSPPSRPGRPKGLGTGRPKSASFASKPGGPPRKPANSLRPKPKAKSARPKRTRDEGAQEDADRLQKVLAHAGVDSRRACEDLILQGRITVDGKVVRELGTRVDPETARIEFDGQRIKIEKHVYYAVNKPKGYVSTNDDPSGRPRVLDMLPEIPQRVYTVGRLDEDSTGLILLTNDGELANKLAHPRYGVEKLYRVLVAGLPSQESLQRVTDGVWLADGKVRAKRVKIIGRQGEATNLELVLAEGKNREVRRIFAKMGHKVMSLTRVAVGPILLKGLAVGEHRILSKDEVELLRKTAAGIDVSPSRSKDKDRKPAPKGNNSVGSPKSEQPTGASPKLGPPLPPLPRPASSASEVRGPSPAGAPSPAKRPTPGGIYPNMILPSGAVVGARPGTGSRPPQQPQRPDSGPRPGAPSGDRRQSDSRDRRPAGPSDYRDRRPAGPSTGSRPPSYPVGGRSSGPAGGRRPGPSSGDRPSGPSVGRPAASGTPKILGPKVEHQPTGRKIIGLDPSAMPSVEKKGRPENGQGSSSGPKPSETSKQKRPPRAAHGVKRKPRNKDRG